MSRALQLRGDNGEAYHTTDADYLLCGPAGTGKTVTNLTKIRRLGEQYPGARMLMVRKTRASLTETGLVTWERDILGPNHPILTSRPVIRRVRQDYQFANGSSLVIAGMDKPDKALSSEWDLIYFLEAIDFTLDDFETLSGRLRSGMSPAVPYQQIIADCNPTRPTHWLYNKINSRDANGKPVMLGFNSTHKDNPAYWNIDFEEWTPAGLRYMERLSRLTGARKARFYEGRWAAAEGLVFDGYNPAIHNMPAGWRPPDSWRRFWSIDWGYTAPLCLQFWALDNDNRMYLYREIYQTGLRVETLAKMCKAMVEANEELRPFGVVTDHDPEAQETWRVHSGLPCESAWKEDKYEGIELAQGRFDLAGDGKPQIFIVPDARYHRPDETLAAAGKPTCTLEEIAGYVWDMKDADKKALKELPVKLNDHGCDNIRYAVTYVHRMTGGQYASTGDVGDTIHGDVRNQSF